MVVLLVILSLLGTAWGQKSTPDGPRGVGTNFSKCGGTFFGGKDRCFEVTLKKFQVQMGSDGTDDNVSVKVCSDDGKTCCTTPPLKKSFSDDWSSNDLEQWNQDYLGPCKNKTLKIKRGLDVSLVKPGTDTLAVSSFFIEAEGVTKPKGGNSPERFDCGRFNVNGKNNVTNFCGTSPYSYERIKQIKVAIGPDGTNDDVRIEFCSDVNDVCCRTRLHHLLRDDWSKNDDEVWDESDLGDCKTVLYKVRDGLKITLLKDGKDDLVVNKLTVDTTNLRGATYMYDCKGFNLVSQGRPCVEGVTCKQEKVCPKTTLGAGKTSPGAGRRTTTTRRPTTTTRRTTTTTTKKAGFLDRIKGSLGLGGKKTTTTTTTTTTRRGLIGQVQDLLKPTTAPPIRTTRRNSIRSTTTSGSTTRPPFRG